MNWDKNFWKNVLREDDGTPSTSRSLTAAVILSSLGWITYIVFKNKAIPELSSVRDFDLAITTSLYGINKIASTVKAVTAAKSESPNSPQQ